MIRRTLFIGRTPHICVVGAGISGMRAAQLLSEKGMKVTVFEGRDRIGGRMHQSNHLGHWVDLGPNWIHGTNHNPFIDLAKETNTTTFSVPELTAVFDELGHPLDQEKATKYSDVVWGMISDAFKYSKENSASIPASRSLRDYLEEQVKDKELSHAEQRIVLQMAEMWGAFVGDPLERQSLKFFWLEEFIDGENLFVASTYKSILNHIGTTALANATVHLSTKVTSIESRPPSRQNPNPEVVITTATGSTHTFDEVVMTAPLGYLKRNTSTFVPPLPTRIATAINNISYGRLEKVYLTFPTAFWDGPPSATPSSPPHPFFTHFLPPTYTPTNPHHWPLDLISLSALPPPTRAPTLLFYLHGPFATHLVRQTSHLPPTSPSYHRTLRHLLHPYYSRLPNYTPTPSCTPGAILATAWQADEFAGWGSYCNFLTSDDAEGGGEERRLDEDLDALRAGMPERGVWFAGEHVARVGGLGTVTGAWGSGEAVAGRIVEGWWGGRGG
ncbi:hypothetical protein MMC08_002084 [Hypocenomyce scalaris]|nr:hypothetical protein [Hypocenomyce scalaris]